jgi:hypothetical protein
MIAMSSTISSHTLSGSPFSMSANVRASASVGSTGPEATIVESADALPCLIMIPPQFRPSSISTP